MSKQTSNRTVSNGKTRLAAFAAAMAMLSGSQAFALTPAGGPAAPQSPLIKAHGCHRSCEFGYIPRWDVRRWHRHEGPACLPVRCVPLAPHPDHCWVDGWGVRHCRW